MASHVPYMAFLRPLAPPRTLTVQRLLRFSTSRQCCEHKSEDPNLVASRTADPAYPPSSMKSLPRPKISKASRRTSHPVKQRPYPTREVSHHQPTVKPLIPGPVVPLAEHLCAPNLPYYVNRTKSKELPVYNIKKRAGSMLLTQVRKIDGNVESLREELQKFLRLKKDEVNINPVTQHVMVKGHHRDPIKQYLYERKF